MDKGEIIRIVQKEIQKISNSSLENINESCTLKNTGQGNIGLCSLELVQLLVELERIFHIEFDGRIETIYELVEYIEKKHGELK